MDVSNITPQDDAYWDQVERLFAEASALSIDARIPFLQAACSGNDALFKEVASLLEASDQDNVLDKRKIDLTMLTRVPEEPPERSEEYVGPYRLIRILGYGGMGAVYLAERSGEGFEQRVAIKLIRKENASETLKQRFFRERQILARLEHKHIARFLDGGMADPTTLDPLGQPFLAMEYVDGAPITDYCDNNRLSIQERLQLFSVVCETVHYAHRHLVIHRDLKPSNILVTTDGDVKLLDFGVAKLLTKDEHAPLTQLTKSEMRILTPGYAAPEQFLGHTPTTATDVYSLGVVLYELLTGNRPHQLSSLTAAEMERVVCEKTPATPSSFFRQSETTSTSYKETAHLSVICDHRTTTTQRLHRQLQGDLDTIVMKALAIEPDRRYGSAEAFMHDIERYLEGQPVLAQKATFFYRFQKFASRNKRAVLIAGLFALSLIAGLAGTTWQAQRATDQRDLAQSEALKAEQVSAFLTSLFEKSDPFTTYGDTLTAFDILTDGANRLQNELADQPEVRASLLLVMAQSYRNLGDYESARNVSAQALELREKTLPRPHGDLAESLADLAETYSYLEDQVKAESLFVEALAMQRVLYEEEHPDLATTLDLYADVLFEQGEYLEAETLYVEALDIRRNLFGQNHQDVATSINSVATIYYYLGRYEEAEPLFKEALAIRREVLDPRHPDIASSLNNLAIIVSSLGNHEEAEPLYREALEHRREVFGDDHPRISTNINNLATVLANLGKFDEAEELLLEAIDHVLRTLGEDHPRHGLLQHNLGRIYIDKGDLSNAITCLSNAITLRKRILPTDHPDIAFSLGLLGTAYQRSDQHNLSEETYREALGMLERTLPEGHSSTDYMKSRLASALNQTGGYVESEALLLEVLPRLEEAHGRADPRTQATANWLAELYDKTNRQDEADTYKAYLTPSTD